jgi:hypothetical protein
VTLYRAGRRRFQIGSRRGVTDPVSGATLTGSAHLLTLSPTTGSIATGDVLVGSAHLLDLTDGTSGTITSGVELVGTAHTLTLSPTTGVIEESGNEVFASVQTISAPASTGSQTYSCPVDTKALIFMGVGANGTADGYVADWGLFYGAATASGTGNQWCVSGSEDDGSDDVDNAEATSNAKCIYAVKYNASTGTVPLAAALTDLDAVNGDFTLNWTATVSGAKVRVMAIGGANVAAKAGTFNRRTTTGTTAITGVGFLPVSVLFATTRAASDETNAANLRMGLGATGAIGEHWATFQTAQDAVALTNASGKQITTKTGIGMISGGGSTSYEFSLDSYDADGFMTNFSTASGSAERVHYLALNGISVDVGSFNQPTAGGAQNQDSPSLGFDPTGVLLASYNFAASTSVSVGNRFSLGMADGTNVAAVWAGATKSVSAATDDSFSDDAVALHLATEGTPTTNAQIDTVTMGTDEFTVHWSSIDATARQILYWAFGPPDPPNVVDSLGNLVVDSTGESVTA